MRSSVFTAITHRPSPEPTWRWRHDTGSPSPEDPISTEPAPDVQSFSAASVYRRNTTRHSLRDMTPRAYDVGPRGSRVAWRPSGATRRVRASSTGWHRQVISHDDDDERLLTDAPS